jgi:capsular polysaccharide biosynthesis protein
MATSQSRRNDVNEERLSRRSIIAIMAAGLVVGVVALLATMFVVGNAKPTYSASALLSIIPSAALQGPTAQAGDQLSVWEALNGGQAGKVASEVFQQPKWSDGAAQTLGVASKDLRVTAGPPPEATTLIKLTVEAPAPQIAEQAVDLIIKSATGDATKAAGGSLVQINTVQDAGGTAVSSGVPASQLLIVVFIGGLLVGSGAALIIARARSRSDEEPEYLDSGQFPAVQGSGYGRPVAPPAGRPVNGGPGSNGGGQYGAPPRRPAGDPRAQPPR